MKCYSASYIPHQGAFVHNFLQIVDIILLIGQNKNTLRSTQVLFLQNILSELA